MAQSPGENGDFVAVSIEPVQVVWGSDPLIEGKNTVFVVVIHSKFTTVKTARIKIELQNFYPPYSEDYITSRKVILNPGVNRIILPLEEDTLPFTDEFSRNAPRPKLPQCGYAVYVDPDNTVEEVDEENNRYPTSGFINSRVVENLHGLRLLYIGLCFPWEAPPGNLDDYAGSSSAFMLGTYPIDDMGDLVVRVSPTHLTFNEIEFDDWFRELLKDEGVNLGPRNRTADLRAQNLLRKTWVVDGEEYKLVALYTLYYVCRYLAEFQWINELHVRGETRSFYDRVVGVVTTGWFSDNFGEDWAGLYHATIKGAVLVDVSDESAPAHEIGHSYGLPAVAVNGEEYVVGVTVGNPASGFWVNKWREMRGCICFMGMAADNLWVDNRCYAELRSRFSTSFDPEALAVSGLIYRDGHVVLQPWYRVNSSIVDLELGSSGNYSLVMIGEGGEILGQVGFNASFYGERGVNLYFTAFAFKVPWIDGTRIIELRNVTGHVVANRTVSANPPSVTVIRPNGGEQLLPSSLLTITWEAEDADGDPLTYAVSYSPDGGETWFPLAIGLKDCSYTWNLTEVPPGDSYLISVVASDSVNTGWDISDSTFTVLTWREAYNELLVGFENLSTRYSNLTTLYGQLKSRVERLETQYNELLSDHKELLGSHRNLTKLYEALSADYADMAFKYDAALANLDYAWTLIYILSIIVAALSAIITALLVKLWRLRRGLSSTSP